MKIRYNTLVISDLHLGEDLSPSATEANRLHVDIVERELISFLRHYARRREDGRPWRLVANGDLVDFLAVCVFPDHPDFRGAPATVEDRQFGFPRTPPVTDAKLRQVIERHMEVFRAMARFVSRGNRIEIISGNHDTEFHWPSTQERFRQGVVEAWRTMPESQRPGAPAEADLARNVGFHPWFFYEPGSLWIEHGHQYDECCSFEHQLYPRRPESDQIVTNVDTAGVRYITNYIREADAHNQESWSGLGYLRFGMGLGVKGCWKLVRAYHQFAMSLLKVWRAEARRTDDLEEVNRGHQARMTALAEAWDMDPDTLVQLDGLRKRPVVEQLWPLSRVVMLDKLLSYFFGILLAFLAVFFLDGYFAVAGVVFGLGLGYGIGWWSSRRRTIDPAISLELAPGRILRHVDARYVIFGHTHEPVARQLDDGAWYFNTGTWLPTGKPGLLRAFTHVVARHREGGVVAELCQWRDGASRAFTPGWSAVSTESGAAVEDAESKAKAGAAQAA